MAKRKIELRKPQYILAKEVKTFTGAPEPKQKLSFAFRVLLFSSYVLSVFAIWHVYQKFAIQP